MGDVSQGSTSVSSSHDKPRDVEEEELRMLASLCREEEDSEPDDGSIGSGSGGGGPTLSASQRRRCNVSLSTSSDDTTTWTQCYPVVSRHVTRGWKLLQRHLYRQNAESPHPSLLLPLNVKTLMVALFLYDCMTVLWCLMVYLYVRDILP